MRVPKIQKYTHIKKEARERLDSNVSILWLDNDIKMNFSFFCSYIFQFGLSHLNCATIQQSNFRFNFSFPLNFFYRLLFSKNFLVKILLALMCKQNTNQACTCHHILNPIVAINCYVENQQNVDKKNKIK